MLRRLDGRRAISEVLGGRTKEGLLDVSYYRRGALDFLSRFDKMRLDRQVFGFFYELSGGARMRHHSSMVDLRPGRLSSSAPEP